MAAVAAPPVLPPEDREEIRFALAMNGGVSLAVWMGGVAQELDRLRRGEGVWAEILDLLHSTARVDVIAGASAGGLNGALLALAVACNTPLERIRELWLTKGSFNDLVRDPFDADPPSLLRGDDYFLPSVRAAMEDIVRRRAPDPDPQPLHLTITATTLTGETRAFPDALGSLIADSDHRARFVFERDPDAQVDDFSDDLVAARLALAARTSSSFPGAFEPSYIPVGSGGSDERPDMQGYATFPKSRWAIDGGVLVNMPVAPMLEAIFALPAAQQVRRVAALVVPSPSRLAPPKDDPRDELPKIFQVTSASVSGIPRQQSIGEHLSRIAEHNRRVGARRERRIELVEALDADGLRALASQLAPSYVRVRTIEAAEYVSRRALAALARTRPEAAGEQHLRAIGAAVEAIEEPPWLADAEVVRSYLEPGRLHAPGASWPLGLSPIERITVVTLDVLRQILRDTPIALVDQRKRVCDLRLRAHRLLRSVRELRTLDRNFWEQEARSAPEGTAWVAAAAARWKEQVPPEGLQELVQLLCALLSDAPDLAATAAGAVPGLERHAAHVERLAPGGSAAAALPQLLALEIVERVLGPDERGPEQRIETLQLSGNAWNAFDPRTRAHEKLAGLQLEHFGAFYKSSWRANDWLWGRLDGAARLVEVLLSPQRLRQLGYGADLAFEKVRDIAVGGDVQAQAYLDKVLGDGAGVQAELTTALASAEPGAAALPKTARALARRVQLEILREEIPVLARCILDDEAEGGPQVPSRRWARTVKPDEPISAEAAVECFRDNTVGEELIADEIGTDPFTSVVTKTVATATTALRGKNSGLIGPLRTAATASRGVALPTYLLARGAVARSKTGSFVVMLVLAVAGAIVAIPLVTTEPWGPLTTFAALVLAGGFLLALIRSGWRVLAVLALLGTAALAACLLRDRPQGESVWEHCFGWLPDLGPVIPIAAIIGIAILFGLIRKPRLARRRRAS